MDLPQLSLELLRQNKTHNVELPVYRASDLPVKVLQIGEGVFLRAFATWMIHRLNQAKLFNGSIVVAQPRAGGHARKLNVQDGLFTLVLRGQANGKLVQKREIVGSIRNGIDPYTQHEMFIDQARNPDLRFVLSNTTEAGIAITDNDKFEDKPAISFPAKVAQLLHERFRFFNGDVKRGLVFLPCELIEANGDTLKKCILDSAAKWNLDADFIRWVEYACVFANTLVDQIVTGFPTAEAAEIFAELGYTDTHLDAAEPYHAWVIEAPESIRAELPLDQIGLNVTWTSDVRPYRERKVKLLNGAHTMTALPAVLAGVETVRECTQDADVSAFLRRGLFAEIIPTIDQPRKEVEAFANDVLERFANPFIQHKLASIALNSTAKFKARLLPALKSHAQTNWRAPNCISLALASLICLYRKQQEVQDDPAAVEKIRNTKSISELLADVSLWGEDLTQVAGLATAVGNHIHTINESGPRAAITATLR